MLFRVGIVLAVVASPALAQVQLVQAPVAPVIDSSVTVLWSTDVPSSTELHYGIESAPSAASFRFHSVSGGAPTILHSRTVSNLAPGTYTYVVRSSAGINAAESPPQTFTIGRSSSAVARIAADGPVTDLVEVNGAAYFFGSFAGFRPRSSRFLALRTSDGASAESLPDTNGDVNVVISDGAGGWFIGGGFTRVGGVARSGFAHFLPDFGVDGATPLVTVNGTITDAYLEGNTLFLAGRFTSVNGQSRQSTAAINTTTGALLTMYDPGYAGHITRGPGNTLFVWGGINSVPPLAVDVATRARIAWPVTLTGGITDVTALEVTGNTVYLAGNFTSINGTPRPGIAALDATTAAVRAWMPTISGGSVTTLAIDGARVLLGGTFTDVNGSARTGLAAVDPVAGFPDAWAPALSGGAVSYLRVRSTDVLVGGTFTRANGTPVGGLVGLSLASGANAGFDASLSGPAKTALVAGSVVLVGGNFAGAGPKQSRQGVAAIDSITGELLPWAVTLAGGSVTALAATRDTIYLGGSFTGVGGAVRPRAAAVSLDATVLPWDPRPSRAPTVLCSTTNSIIIGSDFSFTLQGQNRSRCAEVDLDGGVLPWNPASPTPSRLREANGVRYVSSVFSTLAFDADGGSTLWAPSPNIGPDELVVTPVGVYLSGRFNSIQGMPVPGFARVDLSTGAINAPPPALTGNAGPMVVNNGTVYLGGGSLVIDGQARKGLGAFDSMARALPFAPRVDEVIGRLWGGCAGRLYAAPVSTSSNTPLLFDAPIACGGNAPSIQSNVTQSPWFSTNAFGADVDFFDAEGLAEFDVSVSGSPESLGPQWVGWTRGGTLVGTASTTDWGVPATVWDALPDGESYIAVRVRDVDGNARGLVDAFTLRKDTNPPTPPVGVTANALSDGIEVRWGIASDAVSGVSGFTVLRWVSDGGSPVAFRSLTVPTTMLSDMTAPADVEMAYALRAMDYAGNSSVMSNIATATYTHDSGPADAGSTDGGEPTDAGSSDAGDDGGSASDAGAVSDAGRGDDGGFGADGGSNDGGGDAGSASDAGAVLDVEGNDAGITSSPTQLGVGCGCNPGSLGGEAFAGLLAVSALVRRRTRRMTL